MRPDQSKLHQRTSKSNATYTSPTGEHTGRGRRRLTRFLPFLFIAIFIFLIARDKIPAVDDWFMQVVNQEQWQAKQACEKAALAAAQSNGHARIISSGQIHRTQAGFMIEQSIIGHMTENGTEARFQFSCYTSQTGELIKTHMSVIK